MLVNLADAAPFAYITNAGTGAGTDSVSVIDTATNGIVTTVTLLGPNSTSVPTHPYGVAINPAGNRVYISNQATKTVSVIDASSTNNTVIGSIDNGGLKPGGLAVTPAGSRLLVANDMSTSVTVYDANPPYAVKGTINDTTNTGFEGIAIVPGAGGAFTAYVTTTGSNKVVVISGNETTDVYSKATDIVVGTNPVGIAYNPTNQKLYVANSFGGSVSVIAAASNTVTSTVTMTGATPTPIGVAVDATGNKVYVTDNKNNNVAIINGATDTLLTTPTINTGQAPYGLAFNPANNTLYVANGQTTTPPGTVTAFNTSSQVSSSINVNSNPMAFGNFVGPAMYAITVTTDSHGTTSPAPGASDGKIYVGAGQNITVTPVPNPGYTLATLTCDGVTSGTGNCTFTNVAANHTLSETFTQSGWPLTVVSTATNPVTGTVTCSVDGAHLYTGQPQPDITCVATATCNSSMGYKYGATVTCTATTTYPVSWSGGCSSTSGNTCTVNIPAAAGPAPATVTASFASGGLVKCLTQGSFYSTIQAAYNGLTASDTISVDAGQTGEAVDMSQTIPLVVELRGSATDQNHTAWTAATPSNVHSLNIGGNGANGTTVVFQTQYINSMMQPTQPFSIQ
jgi:YVTN family beta-propeller protein